MSTTPMPLLRPSALKQGDTIGIFTPSSPSYQDCPDLFENGLRNISEMGFKVKLGQLTEKRGSQGYRSGTPQDRASEFMGLYRDPDVKALVSTIGGLNSSSLIPYLDFEAIRRTPKIVCGYSDVTSLHLAILAYAGVRTFYGPALMTWFGEFPNGIPESTESFLQATMEPDQNIRRIKAPKRWSNHSRRWATGEVKTLPREWQKNLGWKALHPGTASAPLVLANLNTLMSAAGTSYFPDFNGKILLIESMDAPFGKEERNLRHLQLLGIFDKISGLIIGKPERPDSNGAPFSHEELILEIVGRNRPYPIVSQFDCSHTVPMLTFAQMTSVQLDAKEGFDVELSVLEPMVTEL